MISNQMLVPHALRSTTRTAEEEQCTILICQVEASNAQAIDIPASKATISGNRWHSDHGAAVLQRTLAEESDCKDGNRAGPLRVWGPAAFSCAGATPACCYYNLRCLWYDQKVCSGAAAGTWNSPIIAPDPTTDVHAPFSPMLAMRIDFMHCQQSVKAGFLCQPRHAAAKSLKTHQIYDSSRDSRSHKGLRMRRRLAP